MSITSILHVTSRCGGGKSKHTIAELYKFIQKTSLSGKDPALYIIASKTNKLSLQNYENFCSYIRSEHITIDADLLDSHNSNNVLTDISNYLINRKSGVLFISHSSLSRIDSTLLKDTYLITDEVPIDLVKPIRVQNEDKDSGSAWEKFLIKTTSKHDGYELVKINPTAEIKNIERLIENVREGRDNTLTMDVINLLQYLLDGHEALYATQKKYNNKKMSIYRGINWKPLAGIQRKVKNFVVLSAQIERTLFGFTAKHVAGLGISTIKITDDLALEEKHHNKARIYPLLKEGQWSTYLKYKRAADSIIDHHHPIESQSTVIEHFQWIARKKLGTKNFLLFLNTTDAPITELQANNVTLLTTASHGINSYSHIDHAVYLASNRPDPIEVASLSMFARDHNLKKEDILEAVITERCHETSYQCIARTSIRNATVNKDLEHIFIVPDLDYAEYLQSWFIPGMATIDNSLACEIKTSETTTLKELNQKATLTRILQDLPTMKLDDLLAREGISIATYKRHRKKFKQEMQHLGLIS